MTPKSKKLVVMGDSITDCGRARPVGAVSYTHLTLPTILRV